VKPDKFVILEQFLTAINNLPVSNQGNCGILHIKAGLLTIAAVEKSRAEDFVRHGPLLFFHSGRYLGHPGEPGQQMFK